MNRCRICKKNYCWKTINLDGIELNGIWKNCNLSVYVYAGLCIRIEEFIIIIWKSVSIEMGLFSRFVCILFSTQTSHSMWQNWQRAACWQTSANYSNGNQWQKVRPFKTVLWIVCCLWGTNLQKMIIEWKKRQQQQKAEQKYDESPVCAFVMN